MAFLRCTLVRPATGQAHDVELTAEPHTPVESLLAALPLQPGGQPVYVGGEPLDPQGAVGDSPLTVGCVLSVGEPGPDYSAIPENAVGVLRVVAGPDVGRWCWVAGGGRAVVGRGEGVQLGLSDPQVSRVHAEVLPAVPPSGARLRDVGSANGTTLAGAAVENQVELPDGGVFEVGSSLVQWTPLDRVDRVNRDRRRTPDARIEFTRRFHRAPTAPPVSVNLPTAPPDAARGTTALLTSLGAPVLLGVGSAVATRNPSFLLMALLSPLALVLQNVVARRGRRAQEQEFTRRKSQASAELAAAVTWEEQVRRWNDPDELSLTLCALGALPGLWTKRLGGHYALTVRVGVRDEPASVELRGERWEGLPPPRLRAVPVTVDLRETGVLGVVGDPVQARGLARWLVVQLATRRSPEDLSLVVLSSDEGDHWRSVRWLPHADPGEDGDAPCRVGVTPEGRRNRVDELRRLVEARENALRTGGPAAGPGHGFDHDVVVVLDGARELRELTGMRRVLTRDRMSASTPSALTRPTSTSAEGASPWATAAGWS